MAIPVSICRRIGITVRMVSKPLSDSVLNEASTLRHLGLSWDAIAERLGTTVHLIRNQLDPDYAYRKGASSKERYDRIMQQREAKSSEDPFVELLRKYGHEYAE